jgi:ACS family tartrate transporter-like MFS transporter
LLEPRSIAMGIVAINIVGSFAGYFIPGWMGQLKDSTGSFLPPIIMISGILAAGAILCLLARLLEAHSGRAAAAVAAQS